MPQGRARTIREGAGRGPVIYWMSRDQRVRDNQALAHAAALARSGRVPLHVAFCLSPDFLGARSEHYSFMTAGLQQVGESLDRLGIPFHFLAGSPGAEVAKLSDELSASAVVCDLDPLRLKRQWKADLLANCLTGVVEVDAHNIVPCWAASPKKEWAAATFRPKIRSLLPAYMSDMPAEVAKAGPGMIQEDWRGSLQRHSGSKAAAVPRSGETAALSALNEFIRAKLSGYSAARNDPNRDGQSGLSPYLHFGQISAQRVAVEVAGASAPEADKAAFLEELIVRRELSDNFCFYEKGYDAPDCFPAWARASLQEHLGDRREYLYSLEELERAATHDPLWNAAQRQMAVTGKMHGYLRMYWAKKMLEWAETPAEALRHAIILNDRYSLDGRDANGYAGIAWSIGGVHDRAWPSRPIFGKVRYMSLNGARSKFDVDAFVARYPG